VLDVPNFFWDSEPTLHPLYIAVREYLEIKPRIQVLNERCRVFLDLAEILSDSINDRKMSRKCCCCYRLASTSPLSPSLDFPLSFLLTPTNISVYRHNLDHHLPHHPQHPRYHCRSAPAFRAVGQEWPRGKERSSAATTGDRGTYTRLDSWDVVGSVGIGEGRKGLGIRGALSGSLWCVDSREQEAAGVMESGINLDVFWAFGPSFI